MDGTRRRARTLDVAVGVLALLLLVAVVLLVVQPFRDQPPPVERRHGTAPGRMWVDATRIRFTPARGPAWDALMARADRLDRSENIDLNERNSDNTSVLAAAIVAVRLDDPTRRAAVADAIDAVVDTTRDVTDVLAVSRQLVSYVIAADLIRLDTLDSELDDRFRAWLQDIRTAPSEDDGRTLVSTHETRPNNWGTHAGASRIAAALYLDDQEDLERAAEVFAGWLGDRDAYTGFEFGDLDWQCDPDRPVGINPAGCTIDGHDVDGVLPDDQRRGGEFEWPPPEENYVWEALQGAVVQAELLDRAGFDAWSWSDQALLRAVRWLDETADFPAEGDDTWTPWLVNHATGSDFSVRTPTEHGKNVGFTDWTHAPAGRVPMEARRDALGGDGS